MDTYDEIYLKCSSMYINTYTDVKVQYNRQSRRKSITCN